MKLKQLFTAVLLFFAASASAQDYCMTSAVGYGRGATGGAGGAIKTVKTVSELKAALTASGAAIIIVTENITFGANDMINAAISNKTLLGLKGVKLIQNNDNGILGLNTNSSNVIIRNLIFEGPGAYDVDGNDLLGNKGCNNLWVDHCEFYDGLDGNFDNTNSSDNISVSWCKFGYNKPPRSGGSGGSSDHRFTNLVSASKSDAPSDGRRSITFLYCYWTSGCKSRMPRARNADLHLLNCFNDSPDASPAIGLGGGTHGSDCYVEGCVFENIKTLYGNYNSSDGGTHTLAYVDCSSSKTMNNVGTAPKPAYTCTALPKEAVKDAIKSGCGAGATLDITSDGAIASPCSTDNPPEGPDVPQNITATADATSIRISWNAVTGATGYKIKLSYENTSGSGNPDPAARERDLTSARTIDAETATVEYTVEGGNVTEKTIGNLIPNTEYTYQVKAVRGSEESAYGKAATINTRATALHRSEQAGRQCLQINDELVVSSPDATEINLHDLSGKRLAKVSGSRRINVSGLNRGLYIVSIKAKDGSVYTKKVVKR